VAIVGSPSILLLLPPPRQSPKIWDTITTEEDTAQQLSKAYCRLREKGKNKWGEVKPTGIWGFHLEIDIKLSPLRFFELLFPQRFISAMQSSTNPWDGDGDEVVSIRYLKGSATALPC